MCLLAPQIPGQSTIENLEESLFSLENYADIKNFVGKNIEVIKKI